MFRAFERRLSIVPRWGIVPTIFKQNVAEHSFYVALYTDKLCQMLKVEPNIRMVAVSHALRHDMLEVMHGDIPGPAKDRLQMVEKIDQSLMDQHADQDYLYGMNTAGAELITKIVKFADKLDAAMFLQREVVTGNVVVEHILSSHIKWCNEHALALGLSGAQRAIVIAAIQNSANVRLPL